MGRQASLPRSTRPRLGRRGLLVAASALVVAVVVAVGVTETQDGDAPPAGSSGGLPPVAVPEPGVEHVHGLGVDPGDGTLYAATHFGLFALPGIGPAHRIANRYQDTMGFTVTGPGTFLGSGHPDVREDDVRPPLLGLIESTDAGVSWDRLSLHGEADFHALHAAHGNVYGYDSTSQTFMVSENRRDWDRRSTLPMADFAVDPADPATILATTEKGVVRSTDGGREWQPVAGAPTLVVLTWADQRQLYGVTPDGTVQQSEDGGVTWGERGSVGGQPEAVTVDVRDGRQTLYVAATDRGILASDDQGRTFTTRYSE